MSRTKGNKRAGSAFERQFARRLADAGFWVHIFQDNKNGQPCDVIAAKDGEAYLFDCKDCEKGYFRLERMEENQLNAMKLFRMTGNAGGMFAVRFPEREIYLADYRVLRDLKDQGVKSLGRHEMRGYARSLEDWLMETERCGGGEAGSDARHDWV